MTADISFIFTLKADGHVLTDESMEAFLPSSRSLTYYARAEVVGRTKTSKGLLQHCVGILPSYSWSMCPALRERRCRRRFFF